LTSSDYTSGNVSTTGVYGNTLTIPANKYTALPSGNVAV